MQQAESKASGIRSACNRGIAVMVIVIGSLVFIPWYNMQKQAKYLEPAGTKAILERVVSTQQPATSISAGDQAKNIDDTLQRVAVAIRNNVDVNNDGKVNCIDAAVLFYQWYPNRSKVRIIINRNKQTGMNHLFNAVLIDGIWQTIEPQAAFSHQSSYWMFKVWRSDYNSALDRDATENYLKYVR